MNAFLIGILIFLGVVVGILLIAVIAYFIIINKVKKMGAELGYSNMSEIKQMIKEGEYDSKHREKSITGLTELLVPRIKKDFPSFNKEELYAKVESSLNAIFNILSTKKLENKKDLTLIKNLLEEQVIDLKNNNIDLNINDVVYHKHAIKEYKNDSGALTITVASSLEYYYKNSQKKNKDEDIKKQTAYITKYVYIYDADKYNKEADFLAAHCPNCGAPLKDFKSNSCIFCSSHVEPINLKSWFIASYKEV